MLRLLIPVDPPEAALPPAGTPTLALRGETMGTYWAVKLVSAAGPDPLVLRRELVALLDGIIAEMSNWAPDSVLSRFNAAPAGTWHPLPDDLFTVIAAALDVAAASAGAYDPTIGPLVDLWGFGPAGPRGASGLPTAAEIDAVKARCGWQLLDLNREARLLYQPGGLHIDLSAIAKGFAVDKLSRHLTARSITSHLVDIGGELRGWGIRPDATPWWVGLERAVGRAGLAGGLETRVALHGLSIATSGDSRRFLTGTDGTRLSHTIDPRTGWPVPDRLAAVTVLDADCMMADVWATALGVLGPEAGFEKAAAEGLAALFLLRDGDGIAERMTPALAAMLDEEA